MRYEATIKVCPPQQHQIKMILPISRGPYAGSDILMVLSNLCGGYYVVRAALDGVIRGEPTAVVYSRAEALKLADDMIAAQSNNDCNAVTGGGRWGCE